MSGSSYLSKKCVRAHPRLKVNGRGQLIVPMRDPGGTLHSLQFIDRNGDKRFLPGGRMAGCYFGIGKPNGRTGSHWHRGTAVPAWPGDNGPAGVEAAAADPAAIRWPEPR
jgi:hypothetical protein